MRKPRRRVSAHQVFSLVVVALAVLLLVVLAQRAATNIVLSQQEQTLRNEINTLDAEHERLERRKRYVQTDEYVESVARRDMKLAKPGEVAVIGESAPPTQPTSTPRDGGGPIFA